jgi:hypothetical protein
MMLVVLVSRASVHGVPSHSLRGCQRLTTRTRAHRVPLLFSSSLVPCRSRAISLSLSLSLPRYLTVSDSQHAHSFYTRSRSTGDCPGPVCLNNRRRDSSRGSPFLVPAAKPSLSLRLPSALTRSPSKPPCRSFTPAQHTKSAAQPTWRLMPATGTSFSPPHHPLLHLLPRSLSLSLSLSLCHSLPPSLSLCLPPSLAVSLSPPTPSFLSVTLSLCLTRTPPFSTSPMPP